MNKHVFIRISGSIIALSLLVSCKAKWHVVSCQNITDEIVEFSVSGVQLYGKNSGPQDLGGWTHPYTGGSYEVMGPMRISYPVKISWESKESDKKGFKEYDQIPGLEEGTTTVKEGGVLVVGLDQEYEIQVFFVNSDVVDDKLYQRILKGETDDPTDAK